MNLRKRLLGRTGLNISELGLGGYMFTGEFGVEPQTAGAILDTAISAGINFIDTAAMYGFGEGEEQVGRALRRHPNQAVHIGTKVGWLDRTIVRSLGDAAYRDENALERAIRHSLWLLQRDSVDLICIHEPDWAQWDQDGLRSGTAPVSRVLARLKREGVVGAIGLGGWNRENIADLLETGLYDVALVAGGLTLATKPLIERVVPAAQRCGAGIIVGAPFLQGALATVQRERIQGMLDTGDYSHFMSEIVCHRVLRLYDLCAENDMNLADLTIRYLLSYSEIHTVIIGAQSIGEMEANIASASAPALPPSILERIAEINQ